MTSYDPAALFLLTLRWENLFEPANATEIDPRTYRCKGCRETLNGRDREKHHARHLREQERANQQYREKVRRERIQRLHAVK